MRTSSLLFSLALYLLSGFLISSSAEERYQAIRQRATSLLSAGNYNDALADFKRLLKMSDVPQREVPQDFEGALRCLQNLQRVDEIDDLIEDTIIRHKENWALLREAANYFRTLNHSGYIVAGAFHRGSPRGAGVKYVSSFDRDRIRAIQLLLQAKNLLTDKQLESEGYPVYSDLAETLLNNAPWKLQAKCDISKLPDYEEHQYYGEYYPATARGGAPVDEKGEPVFYHLPLSFESAINDGERWRWALEQVVRIDPTQREWINLQFARFLNSQFGAQTFGDLPQHGWGEDEESKNIASIFSLHTLGENETIAMLASGVRRLNLPDEFNFLRIYRELAHHEGGSYQEGALHELAQIYENRRQYPQAAEELTHLIKAFPKSSSLKQYQEQLDQIVGAWGRFDTVMSQPSGSGATVDFRFRNGTNIALEAYSINIEKLLTNTIEYLKSNPRDTSYGKLEINNIGYRLVVQNESEYIGKKVASWNKALTPAENHFDRRITVETPLKDAGAYLLVAKMAGGNTSRIIVWLDDGAIVKKQLDKGVLYYFSDARTGAPIKNGELSFFGYRQEYVNSKIQNLLNRYYNVFTKSFEGHTDSEGKIITHNNQELDPQYQWLVVAHGDGKFAYLGFTGVWGSSYYDEEYSRVKTYGITDRPVYRPGQNLKYKVWARTARYDEEGEPSNPVRGAELQILNPSGEKVFEKAIELDQFGGYKGSLDLPKDAPLGGYTISLLNRGSAVSFRVEEYKKPEFEVKIDAPQEPVSLGEKINILINAKYYFGAPVAKGKIHYTVKRFEHSASWYPVGAWDWFYGPGYWWFAYDYSWFPGWNLWGCKRPLPWWEWSGTQNPPELVQEQEVEISRDGTLAITIDTAPAKELHGDSDHRYEITAEVTDESRRVITGTGSVLVARKPFKVYSWVDRGYYRIGDTIHAHFSASTLDQKPVQGSGALKLLSISYDHSGKAKEEVVQSWELPTNSEGRSEIQVNAVKTGQYRLSYTVTDSAHHQIEGGYIFTVNGDRDRAEGYRFNEIELLPDKREYAPGEKVKLRINTDQPNATVLFFVRPANGVYLAPEIIRMDGKSTVREIEISKKDMPNFFVEALTVHNGKVYQESKEIVVPPEKRVLNVEVLPNAAKYKPHEEVKLTVKVTDFLGKPFSGTAVIAAYDKSVEYISGGSNVAEIKEFFWKWRRRHEPHFESSLMRDFENLLKNNEVSMGDLGVHGDATMDLKSNLLRRERTISGLGKAKGSGELQVSDAEFGNSGIVSQPLETVVTSAKKELATDSAPRKSTPTVSPEIRKEFADTAFWKGTLTVPESGIVDLSFPMPENLTTWKIRSWVLGSGTRVGEGSAEVVTTKNLVLRLQAPRFFVEKDEVVLSANIHNYLKSKKEVTARIELPGAELMLGEAAEKKVSIDSGGEARVDWRVHVKKEGTAVVRMLALTDEESDAMEMKLPVLVHGMLKTESWSQVVRGDSSQVTLKVPAERRPEQTRLEIRYSPTLAGAMIDALPYLVNYPYGCTEQTVSRFLPTVITARALSALGVSLAQIKEKRTNLNAQEIGDDRTRAKQWKRYDEDPVFDEAEVGKMIHSGIARLTSMQLSDGGWGWFSGWGEQSSAHLTAYVVHGLQLAELNGVQIDRDVLNRGISWLQNYEAEQIQMLKNAPTNTKPYKSLADNLDAFVQMVLVDGDKGHEEMRSFLYRDRNQLSVYGKVMLGLIFHRVKDQEKLQMLLKNIEQFLVRDGENQTAYLNLGAEGYWWYWYGSEFEAEAYYLKLLSRVDPKGEVASGLVKYLLNNRKNATYWSSTRDTAIVVEAFAEYLKASGESTPDLTITVLLDGKIKKEVHVTKDTLFSFDNAFVLEGNSITSGEHTLEVRRSGKGSLYFNAYLTNFTLEDPIARAGLEIKVNRKYYKLIREDASVLSRGDRGQAIDEKSEKYRREELPNLARLKSGDLVEIELEIDSKNDYEYLLFEDMKPAGFEPVEVRSGYNGNDLGAYVEYHDERVAFFVRTLPRGKRSVSYRLRAEVPGTFSALPAKGSAMYAPELKANSDEFKIGAD